MPARNSEVVERLKEYADSAEAINTGDVVGRAAYYAEADAGVIMVHSLSADWVMFGTEIEYGAAAQSDKRVQRMRKLLLFAVNFAMLKKTPGEPPYLTTRSLVMSGTDIMRLATRQQKWVAGIGCFLCAQGSNPPGSSWSLQ
eukprot:2743242-Rhodomonas_salina.2